MPDPPTFILGYQRPSGPAPRPLAGTVVALLGVFVVAVGASLGIGCIVAAVFVVRSTAGFGTTLMNLVFLWPMAVSGQVVTSVGVQWCRNGRNLYRGTRREPIPSPRNPRRRGVPPGKWRRIRDSLVSAFLCGVTGAWLALGCRALVLKAISETAPLRFVPLFIAAVLSLPAAAISLHSVRHLHRACGILRRRIEP